MQIVFVSKVSGFLVVVTILVLVTGTKENTQQIRKRWIAREAVFENKKK